MKRIIMSIVILAFLLPVSTVFGATYQTVTDIESGIQMTYKSSDYKFIEDTSFAVYSLVHKSYPAARGFSTGFSISLERFCGYTTAKDAISKEMLARMQREPNAKSVKGNIVKIPISKDATELILTLKNGMIQRELWFQVDGRFYRITMTASTKYYDKVKKDVDEVLKTLKLSHPLSLITPRDNYIDASDFPNSDSPVYSVGEEFLIPNSGSKVIVKQVLQGEEALAKANQYYVYTTVPINEKLIAVEVEFNLYNYDTREHYPLLLEPAVTQYTKKSDKIRMLKFGFSEEYPDEFKILAGNWCKYTGWFIISTDKDEDTYLVFTEQYADTRTNFEMFDSLKRLWLKL